MNTGFLSEKGFKCWRECSMIACTGIILFYIIQRILTLNGLDPWDAHGYGVTFMLIFTTLGVMWRLHAYNYLGKIWELVND